MPRIPGDASAGLRRAVPHQGPAGSPTSTTRRAPSPSSTPTGRMDGFVFANETRGHDGSLAMGYYDDRDLPYYWNVADEYVLFDRFFTSVEGGQRPQPHVLGDRAAGGDRQGGVDPARGLGRHPDDLRPAAGGGVSWKFYVQNYDPHDHLPHPRGSGERRPGGAGDLGAAAGLRPLPRRPGAEQHIVDLDQYYEDAASGTLPAVSYIAPSGDSEHPPGSIRAGQRLVRGLIGSLMALTGVGLERLPLDLRRLGWLVRPRAAAEGRRATATASASRRCSSPPYARRGYVDSTTLDFTSVLKFIEENWDLEPLAERDRGAKTFMDAFDFTQPPRDAGHPAPPSATLPPGPAAGPDAGVRVLCSGRSCGVRPSWAWLRRRSGGPRPPSRRRSRPRGGAA